MGSLHRSTSHYVDLALRPDPEFAPNHLMSALFSKLHRALVQLQRANGVGEIGISFPQYMQRTGVGQLMRLHGSEGALDSLMNNKWLAGMRDHVRSPQAVLAVPDECADHCLVRRVQAHSSPERQRRRLRRSRPELSEEAILARYPDSGAERLNLAFLHVRSLSTGHPFRLYIRQERSAAQPGGFNYYGLSQAGATVPWF